MFKITRKRMMRKYDDEFWNKRIKFSYESNCLAGFLKIYPKMADEVVEFLKDVLSNEDKNPTEGNKEIHTESIAKETAIQMDKYKFKATNIIAKTFEEKGIKFSVDDDEDVEFLEAEVSFGPEGYELTMCVRIRIGPKDINDVTVGCAGFADIPKEKCARAMEACNIVNSKSYHIKCSFDRAEEQISIEYDIHEATSDECLGEMVFNACKHMVREVARNCEVFEKAIYTDEDLEPYYHDGDDKDDDKDTLESSDVSAEKDGE